MRAKKAQSSQYDKFKKAARELGCDEDEATFDAKLKAIATAPLPKDQKLKQKKKAPAS